MIGKFYNIETKQRRPGKSFQNAFFSLVPDAGYGSHRCQNRRRNRRNNLHNPLKSLFLRHNWLIDLMVNRINFTTEAQRTPSLSESLHRILCVSESLWFYDQSPSPGMVEPPPPWLPPVSVLPPLCVLSPPDCELLP